MIFAVERADGRDLGFLHFGARLLDGLPPASCRAVRRAAHLAEFLGRQRVGVLMTLDVVRQAASHRRKVAVDLPGMASEGVAREQQDQVPVDPDPVLCRLAIGKKRDG